MNGVEYTVPMMPAGANWGGNDGIFGGGGAGGFILGLLFGRNGLFGNGYGNGYGNGAGGYVPGVVEGGQSAGISALQTQLSNLAGQVSQNTLINGQEDISNDVTNGVNRLCSNIESLGRDLLQGQGMIQTSLQNANFNTLSSINGAVRDITAQNNQNALQTLNSFNQLNTNLLQGVNEIGRDAANYANQLVAGQNALSRQVADCCCDIKTAICNDGDKTRALINDIRIGELQTQVSDLKSQVSEASIQKTLAEIKCCACGIPSQSGRTI